MDQRHKNIEALDELFKASKGQNRRAISAALDAYINNGECDGECMTCGQILCPKGHELHFHHDGCPVCPTSYTAKLPALRIFKMNDWDWYAATSAEEALAKMIEDQGEPDEEEKPTEISAEDYEMLTYLDPDAPREEDCCPLCGTFNHNGEGKSFRKALAEMVFDGHTQFPCLFATTEY